MAIPKNNFKPSPRSKDGDGWELFTDTIIPLSFFGLIFLGASKILKGKGGDDPQGTNDIPNIPQGATYQDKVIALQKGLGANPDGIAGKETNGLLENLFTSPPTKIPFDLSQKQNYPSLKARGKGAVSPDNIDFYLDALIKKNYPSAVYTSNQAVNNDAKSIKSAYEKGGILKTRRVVIAKGVVKDTSRNVYVTTGKEYKYNANASFIIPESFARSRVKIIDITSIGNLVVQISQTTALSWSDTFNIILKPSDLIVSN
jgi:hypothetical protein